MEPDGVEPTSNACKAFILPLNYGPSFFINVAIIVNIQVFFYVNSLKIAHTRTMHSIFVLLFGKKRDFFFLS